MGRTRRAPLRLEALENRAVPTVDIFYNGSTLYLHSAPNAIQTAANPNIFSVKHATGAPATQFTIMDGATNLGTYNIVKDLRIQFTRRLVGVQIDLNGGTIPGNVYIDQGHGYQGPFNPITAPGPDNVAIADKSGTGVGFIGGNVQVSGGGGQEVTNIGGFFDTNPLNLGTLEPAQMSILGSLIVNGMQTATGAGESLNITPATTIGGNVSTSQIVGIDIGNQNFFVGPNTPAFIGGSVTATASGESPGMNVTVAARVGGNVSVTSTAGAIAPGGVGGFNSFVLEPITLSGATTDSFVGGNVTVNFGPAVNGNLFEMLGGAGATNSVVGGNVTFIDGNAAAAGLPDFVNLGANGNPGATATIKGSLNIIMANGANGINFGAGTQVNQNLSIIGGNGTNDLGGGGLGGSFAGTVFGNAAFNLGNGTNTFNPTGGVGGQLYYTGGNGSNAVTYAVAAGFNPTVILNFGSGTNSLVMQTANISTLTVNGKGSGPNNTFDDSAIAPITFPVTLNNFV